MPALPFGDLCDLLRAEGIAIGVDHHVRIARLLRCNAAWTPESLEVAIGALVVTDPGQREVFDACWRRWIRGAAPSITDEPARHAELTRRRRRTRSAATIRRAIAVATVAAALGLALSLSRTRSPADGGPRAELDDLAPPVAQDGRRAQGSGAALRGFEAADLPDGSSGRPLGSGSTGQPGETSGGPSSAGSAGAPGGGAASPAPDPAANRESAGAGSSSIGRPGSSGADAPGIGSSGSAGDAPGLAEAPSDASLAWLAALVALAVGGALIAAVAAGAIQVRRARRTFVRGPWRYALDVPDTTRPVLPRIASEYAATDLTWLAPDSELDVVRSVAATIANGGLATPVQRSGPAAPHYLVLEDTAGGAGRWRFLYDEVLRGLTGEGVEVERYEFAGDLDRCVGPDDRVVALGSLLEHSDALIAIGNGDAAINALTGERAAWLGTLHHVPRRLWINPVPPARWSAGAHAIAADTPMEHGVARAVAAVRIGADRHGGSDDVYPAVIERAPGTASAVAALRDALGPRAFRLLAAASVLGPPTIPLVRWLAEHHAVELRERDWLCVVTLPWFQTERWPAGVQARLRGALDRDDPSFVRALENTADELVARSRPILGSGAHLAWQLDNAQRATWRGDRRTARRMLNQVARTPMSHQARGLRVELGLGDRPRAARLVALAVGAVLVAVATHHLATMSWPELWRSPPRTASVGHRPPARGAVSPDTLADCKALRDQRKWIELRGCAARHGGASSAELRALADREFVNQFLAGQVGEALRDGNFKIAEQRIATVPSNSVYVAEVRKAFDDAEHNMLEHATTMATDYAARGDCDGLARYLSLFVDRTSDRIAAAVRGVHCTPRAPVSGAPSRDAPSANAEPVAPIPARPRGRAPIATAPVTVTPHAAAPDAGAPDAGVPDAAPDAAVPAPDASAIDAAKPAPHTELKRGDAACSTLDVEQIHRTAQRRYDDGDPKAAFDELAPVLACRRPSRGINLSATIYACGARDAAHARQYYAELSGNSRLRALSQCLSDGVDPRDPP